MDKKKPRSFGVTGAKAGKFECWCPKPALYDLHESALATVARRTLAAHEMRAPTEADVLQQAILSHALLPRWHQVLDLHQKVTAENLTAIFVS